MQNVLTIILAGGAGKRLYPLTKDRAKPAVPFGGRYRIVDFVLSNFVNSGFYKIYVLTQFKSESLTRHLFLAWRLSPILNHYVEPVPPQMKIGKKWYKGSADAVYQNLNLIHDTSPDYVCVFGADHIYKMDVRQMLEYHIQRRADVTVSAIPVSLSEGRDFGVIGVDDVWTVTGFDEKPAHPKPMPGQLEKALASMGNYIFNTDVLIKEVKKDSKEPTSHDFGRDIITRMLGRYKICAYDFSNNKISGTTENKEGYWRDIGSIDSYWQANMDLVSVSPIFNLYNKNWPIRSYYPPLPPAKFVFADKEQGRVGTATDSLVTEGCIISGGNVNRSILSPLVRINSFSHVSESVLMEGVNVGRYAKIRRAIIDKYVDIPPNTEIGYNLERDRRRFKVSPSGIVVVSKKTRLEGLKRKGRGKKKVAQ